MLKISKGWKKKALVIGIFALLSIGMTFPLIVHLTDHVPSDLGDPLYNVWVIAWQVHQFKTGLGDYWNGNIFYPHQGTLLYADYLFAQAAMSLPLSLLFSNPVLWHNILFIFSFFLCALGAYCLLFYLTKSRAAAFIAGLVFGFFPYNFAHISHLELLSFGWMPFCFLYLHKFFDYPSYKNLACFGFFFILQALSCAYYTVLLGLFMVFFIVFFAYKKKYIWRFDFWVKMTILGLASSAILFPFFYPYLQVHNRMLFTRPLLEVQYYSAELQHFFAVPLWNVAWGWLIGNVGSPEWQLFPGLIVMLLALYWWVSRQKDRRAEIKQERNRVFFWWDMATAFYLFFLLQIIQTGGFTLRLAGVKWLSVHRLRNPLFILAVSLSLRIFLAWRQGRRQPRPIPSSASLAQRFYWFAAIFAWLLSFGPQIRWSGRRLLAGPYFLLYEWVPGFKGLRAPSRLVVIMMLAVSLLAGWGVMQMLHSGRTLLQKKLAWTILGGLVLVEYLSIPMPLAPVPVGENIPSIYRSVKALPQNSVIIELPMPEKLIESYHEALFMYYSIYHGQKLVNGYSGYSPPGYTVVREAMECFPSPKTLALLRNMGVGYVLVHTAVSQGEKGKEIVKRLEGFRDQVELLNEEEGDYLYRFLPHIERVREEPRMGEVGEKKYWRARSNHNDVLTGLTFDSNIQTAWTSGTPQRAGDYFLLDLGGLNKVAGIEFIFNRFPLEFPRGYRLDGSLDGFNWKLLDENFCLFPNLRDSMVEDFSQYRAHFSFHPSEVRFLRITLIKNHENCHWSIQEIICYN